MKLNLREATLANIRQLATKPIRHFPPKLDKNNVNLSPKSTHIISVKLNIHTMYVPEFSALPCI